MFIGDGGTMMLGFMMVIFEFGLFSYHRGREWEAQGVSPVALALAVLCIPIFDTLRVMTARMMRGRSPFKPDKSHLHHLFIDMGFSHLDATFWILSLNFIVMLIWLLLWLCGASVNMQFCIVTLLGFTTTFGFYKLMRWQQHSGPLGDDGQPQGMSLWRAFCRIGKMSRKKNGRLWLLLRKIVDGNLRGPAGGE